MSRKSKDIFRVSVLKWDEHNAHAKKSFKKIMLSTGFLMDARVQKLTPTGKLLFLTCLLVAGESAQSQFDVSSESLCFQSGVKSGSLQSQLDQLQSLQLLTHEKNPSLRIERKKEVKEGIEPKSKIEDHWFYKFLFDELNYGDLGFLNYLPKIEKGFVNEDSFRAWLDLLITAQNFQKANLKGQNKYIIKSIKDELVSRGIK